MNALALTDHGNLHGALEFYQKAKEAGIKPIIGYEAYIAPGSRFHKEAGGMKEASFHLTLLAVNRTGFQNLLKLSSTAFLDGFYFRPRIDKQNPRSPQRGPGVFERLRFQRVQPGAVSGQEPDLAKAMEVAAWYEKLFGDRYFIEIQYNGLEIQRIAMEHTLEIARRMGIPTVATSDVHYVEKEDAVAQDILLCINTGKFRTDANRMRMETNEFYLRSPEEMYTVFKGAGRGTAEPGDRRPGRYRVGAGQAAFSRVHPAGRQDFGTVSPRPVHRGAQATVRRDARAAQATASSRRRSSTGWIANWG